MNAEGTVSHELLSLIAKTLKAFDMARFGKMDDKFQEKLSDRLSHNNLRLILTKLRHLRIENDERLSEESDCRGLYEELSVGGEDALSADGTRYDVGTTKILDFLFPELFVMVDKHVAETITGLKLLHIRRKGSTFDYSFESYWKVMQICRQELLEYERLNGDLQELLRIDGIISTYPRVFDKCAFVTEMETQDGQV